MRSLCLVMVLVMLVGGLFAPTTVQRAEAAGNGFRVAPEVFWAALYINGKRAGFGRGEYGKGEAAPYQYQNTLLFDAAGYRHAQRDWWEFNAQLRPANFFQKLIHWKGGQSVTNTIDGVFHYNKKTLNCEYNQFNTQEKVSVPISGPVVARFTQNIFLAHQKLAAGKTFNFRVYDLQHRRFATQTCKVVSYDGALKAWKIEQRSEEAPGSITTLWFQTASAAHPNGYTLRSTMNGSDKTLIETRAVTRDQAIQGFEREASTMGI